MSNEDVVEMVLALPYWQVQALEELARARGLTAARLARLVLRDYLFSLEDLGQLDDVDCQAAIDDR